MSFGWTMMMRRGAWSEFRRFALLQRANVPSRLIQIEKELSRIGQITVTYHRSDPDDSKSPMTERRQSVSVSQGSALCKLLQAYIAQGGNPFDISMFLMPDSYRIVDNALIDTQPYKGVIYPESRVEEDRFTSKIDTSGFLIFWRYPARKTANKVSPWATHAHSIGNKVESARRWIPQEIKTLRNNLEARILKLCDLREQLTIEKDEILAQALGGTIQGLPEFDPTVFSEEHHLFSVIHFIDRAFYETPNENPELLNPRPDSPDNPFKTLLEDAPNAEEDFTAIG